MSDDFEDILKETFALMSMDKDSQAYKKHLLHMRRRHAVAEIQTPKVKALYRALTNIGKQTQGRLDFYTSLQWKNDEDLDRIEILFGAKNDVRSLQFNEWFDRSRILKISLFAGDLVKIADMAHPSPWDLPAVPLDGLKLAVTLSDFARNNVPRDFLQGAAPKTPALET